ncbi:unnamed protein product [Leptidea sinapis]|uniref:Uncharacterized protein n=1 Tax=Leptidea sinapis TaxID=189913 RepID=A0A5E4PPU1_9NEOP|nr:unnamed protein product [Leptidea sinapis]
MSKLTITNFSGRKGSPFSKEKDGEKQVIHEEVLHKSDYVKHKEKSEELLQKVSKKTPEYQTNKPIEGVFTEVIAHGAFTTKNTEDKTKVIQQNVVKNNGNSPKGLLGFPSSANDLALDAKTDLESDTNISKEVKDKVIEKLFTLVSMVQHTYESKVRIMGEFEKFKETHLKNELRREKEHSEQLYKLNMNFQSEVIQAIQQLRSELDFTRNLSSNSEEMSTLLSLKDSGISYNASNDVSVDTVDKNCDDIREQDAEPKN